MVQHPEQLMVDQPVRIFPAFLRERKPHRRVQESPSLDPVLSRFGPAHTDFNIILTCAHRFPNDPFSPRCAASKVSDYFHCVLYGLLILCFSIYLSGLA
jgi:hypothetical protein